MSKIGRYRRENARKSQREVQEATEASTEPETWPIPPESEWDLDSGVFPYQPTATVRISQRVGRIDGRLVYYAIMLDCRDESGAWKNIWRIDCSDGTVHRHDWLHGMKNRTVIQPIRAQHDVESTYNSSWTEVETGWADMERRWRSGEGN